MKPSDPDWWCEVDAVSSETRVEVSVVIPVYCNADTVDILYERLRAVLEVEGLDFEIIFVNDACPMNSLVRLRALAHADQRVCVLGLSRNVGQHAAVLLGLSHSRGTWCIIMDGDLQDPPEAIPKLLGRAREGALVVFAARRGQYESRLRLLTSRCFKLLLQWFTGLPPDAGTYMVLHRNAVIRLLALKTTRPFLGAMIGFTGISWASVPVARVKRPKGRSAYSGLGRLRSAMSAIACAAELKWRPPRFSFLELAGGGLVEELIGRKSFEDRRSK